MSSQYTCDVWGSSRGGDHTPADSVNSCVRSVHEALELAPGLHTCTTSRVVAPGIHSVMLACWGSTSAHGCAVADVHFVPVQVVARSGLAAPFTNSAVMMSAVSDGVQFTRRYAGCVQARADQPSTHWHTPVAPTPVPEHVPCPLHTAPSDAMGQSVP